MRPRGRKRRFPSSRHAFRPVADGLERRITLSADIGVNLDYNRPYENNPIWIDAHNVAGNWAPASGSTLALSADGYPLANASVNFRMTNYPAGNYAFSYTGQATVSFSNAGQLVGPVTTSNGVTTGTVAFSPARGDRTLITMQVTNVDPSAPMGHFHLMMPGYGDGTTPAPMFTPAFLALLKPFSTIRFINWAEVITNPVADWSDRVGPNAFTTDSSGGVPFEDMIELCNEAQKDMWLNIPVNATPSFVQSLAELVASNLDPNLNVYVELGDELWNYRFEYNAVYAAALANPVLDHSEDQYQLVAEQAAYSIVQDGQTFDQAFGGSSSRVRPILGGQYAWTLFARIGLQFIQQEFGAPSDYIYGVGVAPYVTIPTSDNVAGLTLDQLFAELNQSFTDVVIPNLQADAALTTKYGVRLVGYEFGQGLMPGANQVNYGLMAQAQTDPRMYQLYQTLIALWEQAGGELFNAYQLTEQWSKYGYWGMVLDVAATGSPKYDALLSAMYAPGDINLDGSVDLADLQILEAFYGTGGHWTQGDLDGGGLVNWSDLNRMRQLLSLSDLSLDQFAQEAVFGTPANVPAGTALEYDGFGVTNVSGLPLSSSSGTVNLDETAGGQPIVLGGASYPNGLGFAGNSSASFALGGQYTTFDSTIGVDSSGSTASSVVFEIRGDGTLLYQSPVMRYNSAPVSIEIDVAGVQNLTLTVTAAAGGTLANDHGAWGDARLVSTADLGSAPYTLTWQVARDGQVLSTQTCDSFSFAALQGTYTVALTVTDAAGATASASTTVTAVPQAASVAASFREDTATRGNWIGVYGTQGYDIPGTPPSLPSFASVTTTDAATSTWTASTLAPAAVAYPGQTNRIAAAWYGQTSLDINLNFTDGQNHEVTVYALDWTSTGMQETFQVIDAATGVVLDTESLASFQGGAYLQWTVVGAVTIKVSGQAGSNAIVSGLFIDPAAAATFIRSDTATLGTWIGSYGGLGSAVAGSAASLPSYAAVSLAGAVSIAWTSSTADVRAPLLPDGSGRAATAWYGGSGFTIDVDLTDDRVHDLALYALDWERLGRSEQVQLVDPTTGAVLDTETLASFSGGVYLQWAVRGHVQIVVTNLGGAGTSAVLSGLFLDPTSAASFVRQDTLTAGTWIGPYGGQGYVIAGQAASLPADAAINVLDASTWTWAASTNDVRAPLLPDGSGRAATTWYSPSGFIIDVDLGDGGVHDLALYAVDWTNQGDSEQFQLIDPTTGTVLDTKTLSSFNGGAYVQWAVRGRVRIVVTDLGGPGTNAVVSGVFLDPAGAASFVRQDTLTTGTWIGAYGGLGYAIAGQAASLPSYATVGVAGATLTTWAASTTDRRGLEDPDGSSRTATAWTSTGNMTFDVDLTDGLAHDLTLYAVDWWNRSYQEQIQLVDAGTGAVLDTETLASFSGGAYLQWAVRGHVQIVVTNLGGSGTTAVVSGVFLDSTGAAAFVRQDARTAGTWIGTYGGLGYVVAGSAANLPADATVSVSGASTWTWAASTNDVRAPLLPGGSGRAATTWYSASGFTIDVNLGDGGVHDLALYAVDWTNQGGSEQVQLVDPTNGAVLDTETLASFSGGAYLQWAVRGHVQIVVTDLGGPGTSAVVSGVFLDPTGAASFVRQDTLTAGAWIGSYGGQGYVIAGQAASLPANAAINVLDASTWTWAASTNDVRAPLLPDGSGRAATAWYSASGFTIDVNLGDGGVHDLALYAVDWTNQGDSEQVQLVDPATGAVLDTQALSSFSGGAYLKWAVRGHVQIVVTNLGGTGTTAVISGLFLDPAGTASFVRQDTLTAGTWIGTYGGLGYAIAGQAASLPSYVTVGVAGATPMTWVASTTDRRGLEDPDGSGRTATAWTSTGSMTFDVNLSDGDVHNLALYAVDWWNQGDSEQIQLVDAGTGAVLDTETLSSFRGGAYLQWTVRGHVQIVVTKLSGPGTSAVVSGLFLDPAGAASFVRQDALTVGTWIGSYGGLGYAIAGQAASLPADATISVSGASTWTWAASTNDVRAPLLPGGSGRDATTWYSSSRFTIDVDLGDGDVHDLALYAVDWWNQGDSEQIQLIDPATGAVLDTQALSSFSGGAYLQWTVRGCVRIVVTNLSGPGTSAVVSGLFLDPTGAASFVRQDALTAGTWIGAYGGLGYAIAGQAVSLPADVAINVLGASIWTWAASTTNPRAPQLPDGSGRAAAAWVSASGFTIDVNLSDGNVHDLALYAVDWWNQGDLEQFQLIDPTNGAVLDTKVLSSFSGGAYLQWAVRGHVQIVVTKLSGPGTSAVVSGVFLDPAGAASFVRQDALTAGTWIGAYGGLGYAIAGQAAGLPAYATVSVAGATTATWAASTTDRRGLEDPDGSGRTATAWASTDIMTFDVDLSDGGVHDLALYAVDWWNQGDSEQIQLIDPATGAVLDTQALSSFSGGAYLQWTVRGCVRIVVTNLSGPGTSAVVSGLFLDPTGAASFVRQDALTAGTWIGAYGGLGYAIAGQAVSLPADVAINVLGASIWTWAASTTNPRAPQLPDGSGRAAAAWVSASGFTIDVNLSDGNVHDLALYAVDWWNQGDLEQFQLIDPTNGAVLDTKVLSSFSGGAYLQWAVRGHIQIVVTKLSGPGTSAVVSGVFLDLAGAASFVRQDALTAGTWIGAYGGLGYAIAGQAAGLPAYATVSVAGATTATWAASTTDRRGLEDPDGSGRTATAWASTGSMIIDVNLSDGGVHDLALYVVDWWNQGDSEQIQLIDPATGTVLDSETLSSFGGGAYLQWAVRGCVRIVVTNLSGPGTSAVVSGLFLDPTAAASFVRQDTATQGNWIGTYGSQGYDIEGSAASLPADATISFSGASTWTWVASTTNPRALLLPDGSDRAATTWVSSSGFTIDVDLSDGNVHDLALYAVDWWSQGDSEQFQLIDPATGAVLDTKVLSSFSGGAYLQWAVRGHVQIVVTKLSGTGTSAVVSGLFLDPPSS